MTRPEPQPATVLPLPSAQLALARARITIREHQVDTASLLQACAALETHGDWMDIQTARTLRAALRAQALDALDAPPRRISGPAFAAACLAALLAGALLAHWQPIERTAATVAQAQDLTHD